MTRPCSAALVLCAALAAVGRSLPAQGADARVAALGGVPHPAVVRVVVTDRDGFSFGSGALVAVSQEHGLVVTNWHVVRDAAGPVTVLFPDGFRSGATVLRTDRDWDLAALAIWRPHVAPIQLSAVAPRPGEPLVMAGYGSGRYRAAAGRCTQYLQPTAKLPPELIEMSATARQGDSGGPILNSRGELAGVLFGAGDGYTMGSYCGRVRQFLGTITDDFREVPRDGTMIAQRPAPRLRQDPAPLATIPAAPALPSPPADGQSQAGGGASGGGAWRAPDPAADPEAARAGTPAVSKPPDWKDLLGPTWGEQLKTALAAIGALAVFLQCLRLLGSGEK